LARLFIDFWRLVSLEVGNWDQAPLFTQQSLSKNQYRTHERN
jgi:hypothetical protein